MRALAFAFAASCATAAQAETLNDLHWLEGCWRAENEHRSITEIWIAPPMPAMLGYAFTLTEGEPDGWEQTRIEMIEDRPVFIAMPGGAPPVHFPLAFTLPNRVAFENPDHDFPKRVEYWRAGDALFARVSADDVAIDFAFRRIDCATAFEH